MAGEGCTPPATQSVYYAPSSAQTGNPYAGFPLSTPVSGLVVTPVQSVTVNTSVTLNATGGTPPYRFTLKDSSGGTLNGNVFTAGAMAQMVQIDVGDANGQSATLVFPILTAATPILPTGAPVTYEVYSARVCNGHYCTCGSVSQPGVPNQAAAQAICTAYGHATLTAYTITDGPVGVNQCDPSTGQCYFNNNPANIVCVTVTCQ